MREKVRKGEREKNEWNEIHREKMKRGRIGWSEEMPQHINEHNKFLPSPFQLTLTLPPRLWKGELRREWKKKQKRLGQGRMERWFWRERKALLHDVRLGLGSSHPLLSLTSFPRFLFLILSSPLPFSSFFFSCCLVFHKMRSKMWKGDSEGKERREKEERTWGQLSWECEKQLFFSRNSKYCLSKSFLFSPSLKTWHTKNTAFGFWTKKF